jgi:hypothetical protein
LGAPCGYSSDHFIGRGRAYFFAPKMSTYADIGAGP